MTNLRRILPVLAIAATLGWMLSAQQAATPRHIVPITSGHGQRLALVIGNNAYRRAPLANSIDDARGMAAVLREAGFQVQELDDADRRQIEKAVSDLAASAGDVVLFYYSGHGLQIDGEDYLVPVDFDAETETDAKYKSYPVKRISGAMRDGERLARLKILIFDAGRNPFGASMSASRGLATVSLTRGSFFAFASNPGGVSREGPTGNSLFTRHLIDALRIPGLSLDDVFRRVRAAVNRESGGEQVPWTVSSEAGDFVIRTSDGTVGK